MSSNLRIEKTCEWCNKTFTAKTLVTRFCSSICTGRNYKKEMRGKEIASAVQDFDKPKPLPDENVLDRLEPAEAAAFMRISKRSLYRLLAQGKLKRKKILNRTFILRKDIKLFFKQL